MKSSFYRLLTDAEGLELTGPTPNREVRDDPWARWKTLLKQLG